MNNACPRCHTQALIPSCGGAFCLTCGYEEEDKLSLYAEVMAAVPGAPMPATSERHGVEMRRASDITLAEEAAARHGVSLEDLQVKMHWKTTHLSTRVALQSVIADLTICGLGILRIAEVLDKSARTISKSPGLGRGRAMRGNHA